MKQTWRWFGPDDCVSIDDIEQAGAEGIVSALHHVRTGEIWTPAQIAERQKAVQTRLNGSVASLQWDVVESLPVSEDIKKQSGNWRVHIANYCESLQHLALAGIKTVCYNFMPVLDWTRTDLAWRLPNGATCMRFDLVDFAAFDIFILKRQGAAQEHGDSLNEAATERFQGMSEQTKNQLASNVVFGLPGAAQNFSLDDVRQHLSEYDNISESQLRQHLIDFLEQVAPVAQSLGLRLCCHPDDPPVSLLGLPRIMSCEADYTAIMKAVDTPANGITLCSGSLGARPDNDLPGMMRRLGERVHFLHLRNVSRESAQIKTSFHEAEHLAGDTDMVALIAEVIAEEARRRDAGRADHSIPFRPDHGQDIVDDLQRQAQPGYPLVGRLKGLAELRGIMHALSATNG